MRTRRLPPRALHSLPNAAAPAKGRVLQKPHPPRPAPLHRAPVRLRGLQVAPHRDRHLPALRRALAHHGQGVLQEGNAEGELELGVGGRRVSHKHGHREDDLRSGPGAERRHAAQRAAEDLVGPGEHDGQDEREG